MVIGALLLLGGSSDAATAPGDAAADPYIERSGTERAPLAASSVEPASQSGAGISRSGSKKLPIGFGDVLLVSTDAGLRGAVFDEAVATGSTVVRLFVSWRQIAPADLTPAFEATDPADPQYDWSAVDAAIGTAVAHGQRPLLMIGEAPDWAEGSGRPASALAGTWKPKPTDVADFGTAIARRYSGSFSTLPRVRDYILWNEPNLETNLTPVWKGKSGKKPAAPLHYKKMIRAFYKAVHGVSGKNRVITGGTAPYGADPGVLNMRPLLFWRKVLCVRSNGRAQKRCQVPKFDVLAHHPINTSGGPRRSAISPDDISTPDLHNLIDVLRTAEKAGNVKPKGKRPVWATELWWESNPPDPAGVSLNRQADYYSEAIYLLWKQGASMVLPYQVRDDAYNGSPGRTSFETGAYFVDGKAKPAQRAIRFPFVGDRKSNKKVLVWGVAPESGELKVTQSGKGPRMVAKLKVRAGKTFTQKVKLKGTGGKHKLQAQIGKTKSLKWTLK